MSDYRVEKQSVQAAIRLTDGSTLEGHLYLAPFSQTHLGPQTIPDLMGEADLVVPFRRSDGRFVLVGRAAVVAVRVRPAALRFEGLFSRIPVRLRLLGGHALEGHLVAERGAGTRASDLLNVPDEWFCVESGGNHHWVSKRHLLTAEPDDEG